MAIKILFQKGNQVAISEHFHVHISCKEPKEILGKDTESPGYLVIHCDFFSHSKMILILDTFLYVLLNPLCYKGTKSYISFGSHNIHTCLWPIGYMFSGSWQDN